MLLNCNGEPVRRIGLQEALQMVERGEAIRVSRIKANKLVIRLTEPQKLNLISQIRGTSISHAEVEANVGLRGCRRRARRGYVGNFVDRSMSKIEIWPEVGDTRAIRVGPRSPAQPKPPQSVRSRNASRSGVA
jgi:hypothetical protein